MRKERIIPIIMDRLDLIFLILLFGIVIIQIADMGATVEIYHTSITAERIQGFFRVIFQSFLSYVILRVAWWITSRNDVTTIWVDDLIAEKNLNYHPEDVTP